MRRAANNLRPWRLELPFIAHFDVLLLLGQHVLVVDDLIATVSRIPCRFVAAVASALLIIVRTARVGLRLVQASSSNSQVVSWSSTSLSSRSNFLLALLSSMPRHIRSSRRKGLVLALHRLTIHHRSLSIFALRM